MSWKVFIIPRWNWSVLESERDLTLANGKLKFGDITGKPVIPPLTLKEGTTSPRCAKGTDDAKNSYTLKILVADPGATPTPRFLGQLVKSNPNRAGQEWYDTILALPSDNVLPNTVSDYVGPIEQLYAPAQRLIEKLAQGSIYRTHVEGPHFAFKKGGGSQVIVPLTFDGVFPSNFYCNEFKVPIGGKYKPHQLGGRYVNLIDLGDGSIRNVIFGHIQWDTDLAGAGDKTDPFLAIQPPPPPLGGDGS
ncbi:MAG TPA: hypothetical protein VIA62_00065 [Thermoanaerobaculia bacterium]|jgi:hypothetical protein|nr:hypothetical protein [Thermoanaerobaculia bacterium]